MFSDLYTSVYYHRHSFVCSREQLDRLLVIKFENSILNEFVQHINDQFPSLYGLMSKYVSTYVRLSVDNNSIICDDNKVVISISINDIADDHIFTTQNILLEDIQESKWYQMILEYYSQFINYSKSVGFNTLHGGGENTADVYKAQIESKNICLCIVDTDCTYPGDTGGNTMNQVLKVEESNSWNLCRALTTTPFREIENTIPYHCLSAMKNKQPSIVKALKEYEMIIDKDPSAICFLDIKKGISYNKYPSMKLPEKQYWSTLLVSSGITTKEVIEECNCLSEEERQRRGAEVLLHNCGGNIMRLFSSSFLSLNLSSESFLPCQEEVWLNLGRALFDWSFCLDKYSNRL